MANTQKILDQALALPATERFLVIEGLMKSLDEPDPHLDEVWADEAEARLVAYRSGRLGSVPMEEIFND